jgi:hypothetical protein
MCKSINFLGGPCLLAESQTNRYSNDTDTGIKLAYVQYITELSDLVNNMDDSLKTKISWIYLMKQIDYLKNNADNCQLFELSHFVGSLEIIADVIGLQIHDAKFRFDKYMTNAEGFGRNTASRGYTQPFYLQNVIK